MRLSSLFLAISVACSHNVIAAETPSASPATQENAMNSSKPTANPFFERSPLIYQAPQFNLYKESDYAPAIAEGIKQKLDEVEKIANDSAPPTFENTYVALEKSGALLTRVLNVFGAMTGANTTDGLQKIDEETSPKLAAMDDSIHLNSQLFARLKAVYDQRNTLKLDAESQRLIEATYQDFELAGANLSDADKDKLKALNQQSATLSTQFTNKLLATTKAGGLTLKDKEQLAGLSEAELSAAAQAAKDRKLDNTWLLVLQNTTQQPLLQSLENRETRKALYEASINRAEHGDANDTRQLISKLAKVRAEQAKILGFPSYAAWKLQDQMAKTPKAALDFMHKIVPAATARAQREAADIQALIDKQKGGFKLAAWDWQHYAEQVRKAKYDLDDAQIKPYFELNNVLESGVFYAANLLYGVTFKERHDLPVYNPDVRVFEVFDKDGKSMALFYADYFQRDNKGGGAWMSNYVDQSKLLGTKPVIYNVANFQKPAAGQPALLSWDDVITLLD